LTGARFRFRNQGAAKPCTGRVWINRQVVDLALVPLHFLDFDSPDDLVSVVETDDVAIVLEDLAAV
jgi:hypothetical protein